MKKNTSPKTLRFLSSIPSDGKISSLSSQLLRFINTCAAALLFYICQSVQKEATSDKPQQKQHDAAVASALVMGSFSRADVSVLERSQR